MYLAWLNQEYPEIARAEVEALAGKTALDHDLALSTTSLEGLHFRLAYTKAVYEILFSCNTRNLEEQAKKFLWKVGKTFRVSTNNSPMRPEVLGSIILKKTNSKVDLHKPETTIMVFGRDKTYVCRLLGKVNEPFEARRGKHRPCAHPTTMHPKLARAMINLTGIRHGTIVDPMCGSGGNLIEAGLMGLTVIGYDNDKRVLAKAQQNLKYYGVKAKLFEKDATTLSEPLEFVVCDLPYGRGTTKKNLEKTYNEFMRMLSQNLTKKAVIMFPHWANVTSLAVRNGLVVDRVLSAYAHAVLTRKIMICHR